MSYKKLIIILEYWMKYNLVTYQKVVKKIPFGNFVFFIVKKLDIIIHKRKFTKSVGFIYERIRYLRFSSWTKFKTGPKINRWYDKRIQEVQGTERISDSASNNWGGKKNHGIKTSTLLYEAGEPENRQLPESNIWNG
mgnify:CR=1 FL=1